MLFYDSQVKKIVASKTDEKESYKACIGWFYRLKDRGLKPVSVTIDGSIGVIRAIREVWPEVRIQRCLYHIKHQSEMWLRQYPKTQLARDLKYLLKGVCYIESYEEKERFWASYASWRQTYQEDIEKLRAKDKVEGDTIRAYKMVENAYADMFHYLSDRNIERTSNQLESFFSHLKRRYRGHAGLRREHIDNYLKWYIYLVST